MRISSFPLALLLAGAAWGQFPGLTMPPSGDNQRASVTQFIGPVKITIDYNSPKVHGPTGEDRRGKIWGTLVPYGMANLGFGNGKPSPWRAGANENTVFAVSHPVLIEGKPLPAGRYGFHILPEKDEWTLIFSTNSTSWGSFFYEPDEDALRVKVKPRKHEYREFLTYEFTDRRPTKAVAELQWEDLAAGWTIEVENVNAIYLSSLKHELRTVPGFSWQSFVGASQFCLQNNLDLNQALEWAEAAVSRPFVGQANFTTLSNKAMVLGALGRDEDAKSAAMLAIKHPTANALMIHQFGRQLLRAGKTKEAMAVFQANVDKYGEAWPTHVGLARGYAALGESAKALEHAKKALEQAPDDLNRNGLKQMIQQLTDGKPVPQD